MKKITTIILLTLIPFFSVSQNHSLSFDGLDDYVNLDNTFNFDNTDQFSVEAWIKTDTGTNLQQIISKLDTDFTGWGFQLLDTGVLSGYLFSTWGTNQRYVIGTNNLVDGSWHHVAMTFDGENILLYVDGNPEELSFSENLGGELESIANDGSTHIGNFDAEGNPGEHFEGTIDELRIWSDLRTAEELQLNYSTEISGTEENLIGYYKMDALNMDCDVVDCSPSAIHGQRDDSEQIDNITQFSTDVPDIVDVACGTSKGCVLSTNNVDVSQFNLFPNPTNGMLTISGVNTTTFSITVANLLGDTVKVYNGINPQVDLSSFSSGVYLITIESNGIKATKKIVKL